MFCFSCCMRPVSADAVPSVDDRTKQFIDWLKCTAIAAVAVAALSLVGLTASIVYAAPLGILPSLLIGGVAIICVRDACKIQKNIRSLIDEKIDENPSKYFLFDPPKDLSAESAEALCPSTKLPFTSSFVNYSSLLTPRIRREYTRGLCLFLFQKHKEVYTTITQQIDVHHLTDEDISKIFKESSNLGDRGQADAECLADNLPKSSTPCDENILRSFYSYTLKHAIDHNVRPDIKKAILEDVNIFARTWLVGARFF